MPLEGDFLMSVHSDVPGVIGKVGAILGNKGINIARMGLAREDKGGKALMLVSVDNSVSGEVAKEMLAQKDFREVRPIELSKLADREYLRI